MYESRTLASKRRKPYLILDQKLAEKLLDSRVGDHGQAVIKGSIVMDRKELGEDGIDHIIKTIRVTSIEPINNKNAKTLV